MSVPSWRIWEIAVKIISNHHYRKRNLNDLLPIDIGNILLWGRDLKWDDAVICVSLTYFFFSCENHCMLWNLGKKQNFHTLSKKSLLFPGKMSECLIHFQLIQPSDGAKWDVLFLRIIKHTPSILHPTIKLNWINLSQHMGFFVVRGTTWYRTSTLSLFPSLLILCCLHWGNTDLKACKVSDYLT